MRQLIHIDVQEFGPDFPPDFICEQASLTGCCIPQRFNVHWITANPKVRIVQYFSSNASACFTIKLQCKVFNFPQDTIQGVQGEGNL